MRHRVIRRYGLKTFELSQAYPLFWDKLEKSNWFLANVLDTLDEPLDGRLVSYRLSDPICDGGQWDMFRSLVRKYGVVPKEAMPETACSRNTREMDKYLTRYLRGCARRLRESAGAGVGADDLAAMRREMMDDVHHLLATCLGEYVYQVVVDRRYLTDEERAASDTEEARVLAPWDPMGSLARVRQRIAPRRPTPDRVWVRQASRRRSPRGVRAGGLF